MSRDVKAAYKEQGDFVDCGQEAAVKCWFTSKGNPMPLMLKIMSGNEVIAVDHIEVLSADSRREFSTVNWFFRCQAPIHGRMLEFFLMFYSKECKWKIFV